jgi:hypothetical protein
MGTVGAVFQAPTPAVSGAAGPDRAFMKGGIGGASRPIATLQEAEPDDRL